MAYWISSDWLKLLKIRDLLAFSALRGCVWKYAQSLNKIIDYMAAAKPICGIYHGHDEMISQSHCELFSQRHNIDEIARQIVDLATQPNEHLDIMGQRGFDWLMKKRCDDIRGRQYETILLELLEPKYIIAVLADE